MSRFTENRRIQLLHVLFRYTYRNSDDDRREHMESYWTAPVTITHMADRDIVMRLFCSAPGCQHQKQDVLVESIAHVVAIRLRWRVWATTLLAIACALWTFVFFPYQAVSGIFCIPFSVLSFVAAVVYATKAFTYQGIHLITPREGLGHDIR